MDERPVVRLRFKQLPTHWKKLSALIVELHEAGFTQFLPENLVTLYKKDVSPEAVSASVSRFLVQCKHRPASLKRYKDPMQVLMYVLLKGHLWK